MLRVKLFCSSGMSTSMMVAEIENEAKKRNIDLSISAFPVRLLREQVEDTDVVLLGPQISYEYDNAKKICDKVKKPLAVIPLLDYGMMNGEAVLDLILSLENQKGDKHE